MFLGVILAALAAFGAPGPHDGFQIAQRDGVVVFSRRMGDRFVLVERDGDGRIAPLPVAPSATPFDVELAKVPGRGLVVAFARCRARRTAAEGLERQGCRLGLVRADGRGDEEPLGPPAPAGVSYRFPALQGGRLAYMRVPDSGGRAEVVVDGRVELARDGATGPEGVYGVDLVAHGLAAVFEQQHGYALWRTLVLKRPRERTRTVALGATGEENDAYVLTPAFSGRYLYWGFANHGPYVHTRRSYVFRRDLTSGATTATRLSPYLTSVAVDAGRPKAPIVVTTDDGFEIPRHLVSTQRERVLAAPRFAFVSYDELFYP
jgi:hypothetical protein